MKTALWTSLIISVILGIIIIRGTILSNYEYENKYGYAWELADKSSTIKDKAKYIDEFVSLIKYTRWDFANYDAIYLQTKDNSFDRNLEAVKTLQKRLTEIQNMNPNTFEYQVAIQQITQQEQGEAYNMLSVIKGCYVLNNYWYCWNWLFGILAVFAILLFLFWMFGIIIVLN